MARDQPNSRGKMRDFTVNRVKFLKCAKFRGRSLRNSQKSYRPLSLNSRCYVNVI